MSHKSAIAVDHVGEPMSADRIIKLMAVMLGWGNTPPWHVLEKDLRMKLRLLQELLAESARNKNEQNPKRPEHWRQDTPPEQAVALLGAVDGWLCLLRDGDASKERVLEKLERPLNELRDLLGAQKGYPKGWLKETW